MEPIRKRGESILSFQRRLEDWKLKQAVLKTGMHGSKQRRNRKWQVAELERKLTLSEEEIW